jgi:hypothetical protein
VLTEKTSREPNAPSKRRFLRGALKWRSLGPIADDEQFESAILRKQSTGRIEQNTHTFCGNEPALKRDDRNM